MERRRHWQQHGALGALGFGDLQCTIDRGLVAGDHHLPAAIVVGGLTNLTLGGLIGNRHRCFIVEAEQGRHRAGANRYRLLHGKSAGAQQTRAVSNAEAAGRRQRGVFAKRVSGHEFGVPSNRETGLGLEYA